MVNLYLLLNTQFHLCLRRRQQISENAIDVGCAVLVTVDNRRLGLVMDQHALIVQRSINFDGNAKWKSTERSSIG